MNKLKISHTHPISNINMIFEYGISIYNMNIIVIVTIIDIVLNGFEFVFFL